MFNVAGENHPKISNSQAAADAICRIVGNSGKDKFGVAM